MEKFSRKKKTIGMLITSLYHLFIMLPAYLILDAGLIEGMEEFQKIIIFFILWVISFIISLVYCYIFKSVSWTSESDKNGYPSLSVGIFFAKNIAYLLTSMESIDSLKAILLIDGIYVFLLYVLTVIEIYTWNDPLYVGKPSESIHMQIYKEYGNFGD